MDILINDQKIQYELEGEEHLGEILTGLERWIAGNRNFIQKLAVDRQPVLPEQLDQLQQRVSKVQTVEIHTQHLLYLAAESLETLQDYMHYLDERLLRGKTVIENHDRILEGLDMAVETLNRSLHLMGVHAAVVFKRGTGEQKSLEDFLGELQKLRKELTRRYIGEQDAEELRNVLVATSDLFPKLVQWALLKENLKEGQEYDRDFLSEALRDLHRAAMGRTGIFEEIGEHLQVGRDQPAFGRLASLLEFFHELVTVLSLAQTEFQRDDETIPSLLTEIKGILEEVEQAMKDADMVSVGDLLEYDLQDRYCTMLQYMETLGILEENKS